MRPLYLALSIVFFGFGWYLLFRSIRRMMRKERQG